MIYLNHIKRIPKLNSIKETIQLENTKRYKGAFCHEDIQMAKNHVENVQYYYLRKCKLNCNEISLHTLRMTKLKNSDNIKSWPGVEKLGAWYVAGRTRK